jgi:hypothetical protein
VVIGTGDPNLDVPAVQAAVDQGGSVALMGHFSFDRPPTIPAGAAYSRICHQRQILTPPGKPETFPDPKDPERRKKDPNRR